MSTPLVGCLLEGETMVLLDEKIENIEVAASNGVGDISEYVIMTIDDRAAITITEQAIRQAIMKKVDTTRDPDFDLIVSYGDDFPLHPIHLWVGDENEESILMYAVGEGETYTTTVADTKQLRELLLVD